ncbi:MAG: phosphoethanolamine transferase [Flavobacteriaceae bacterium]|nr:phosphoethanolamine transferase [Flavobacteriaceae bacterium]
MKTNFKNYYLFPLVFILVFPVLLDAFANESSQLYFAFLVSLIIPLIIRILLNIKPFLFVLLTIPILSVSIIYLVKVIEYDSFVDISSWYAVFDTNKNETIDFISNSRPITFFLITLQIFTYLFYIFWTYKKVIIKKSKRYRQIILGVFFFLIIDYAVKGATRIAFPLRSIKTFTEYFETVKLEKKYLETKKYAVFNAKRNSNYLDETKETIVIVIGETLRRDHLEYYGYSKKTTPFLKKEDLIIYKDVISATNTTVNSLVRVFTLAEMLDDNDYWKEPSFIKSFREVGFSTYWLSTQPVYGNNSTKTSFIAQETDKYISYKSSSYDGVLLEPYTSILNSDKKKKLIFLHLSGSHASYKKRYPKEFNLFAKEKHKDYRVNLIREYNNSVKYNDYILYQLLEKLKKIPGEKSFIMFSDHGESLFDTAKNNYAHGSAKPSQSEFNIPLILWFSDMYKKNHLNVVKQVKENANLPILASDFFHSFPALFGIEFEKLQLENNIFGKSYVPKINRKIVNGEVKLLEYNKLKNKRAVINY